MQTGHHHCLNCGRQLVGAYCQGCGQKSSTHRLSMKHFLAHDLVHGIWHLDKGILYTLRQVLTRPGYAAKEYIAGKRTGHFNLITLLLLLSGLFMFSFHLEQYENRPFAISSRNAPEVVYFFVHYAKWLFLTVIPIWSLASFFVYKRLRYNYTEHVVLNGFFMIGALCIMLAFRLLYYIPGVFSIYTFFIELAVVLVYYYIALRQTTRQLYLPGQSARAYIAYITASLGYLLSVTVAVLGIYVKLR